ncbi:hypothetical protein DFQ26_000380 [Actinomortierella ambigua]|nr:hypothetical protein DFQ26_000380 [Actinomortierella ambigua]
MIKSSGTKASSVKERRNSSSSSHTHSSSSSSSWWGLWNASIGGSGGGHGEEREVGADDSQSRHTTIITATTTTHHLSSLAREVITASELDMEILEEREDVVLSSSLSMSSSSSLSSPSGKSGEFSGSEGGLTIAATSGSERMKQRASKRWTTLFGLGGGSSDAKDNHSPSPKDEATTTTTDSFTTTQASDHVTLKTSVAVPNADAGGVATTTKGEGDSQKGETATAAVVPTAPALVSTAEVDVTFQAGGDTLKGNSSSSSKKRKENSTLIPASSSYSSWLSVIPGFGNKSVEDTQTQSALEEATLSHQVTDYEEGERHDIHGNVIKFKPQAEDDGDVAAASTSGDSNRTKVIAQLAAENRQQSADTKTESIGSNSNSPSPPLSAGSSDRQTLAQIKENKETTALAGKAAAALSKMVKPKNMVLPAYYEQFPDARECLLTMPIGPAEMTLQPGGGEMAGRSHGGARRQSSIMSSAVNVLSSILFPNVTKAEQIAKAKARAEAQQQRERQEVSSRGPRSVRNVVIFGIHGWFPTKLVRTVIGEPTGTSQKFCDEMDAALKEYLKANKVKIADENITLIPLEGEGKVLDRVELLYKNLMKNSAWRKALHEADLVLVATHSQGTPTSFLLLARLIEEGHVRVREDDPRMQQVGMLTMAGISHGPFPFLKGNLIVRWFEAEAAGELFEFMDSETDIAKRYWQAIRTVLTSGVRLTCVASLEDQVVPMYSAVMTSISHPSIVRAVYIDGVSYQDDFLTNLISFALRLRNAGIDDHGVLVHLSEVVAGSIYGEGHSTIYDEREVYMLALRALLEPSSRLTPEQARSEPVMVPFKARQRLNPFYLPWGMRGIMEEIGRLGDEELSKGLEHLKQLYEKWVPATKGLKEIKFRLEPVRSKL